MAAGVVASRAGRQHDDPLRQPGRRTRVVDPARAHAGLAVLRSPQADREAPARRPQIGTYTPILRGDGADLAAAVQTIREIGHAVHLDHAIESAFPGASVDVVTADGFFELEMQQRGLLRPLRASELSEGTLRYLLLIAA